MRLVDKSKTVGFPDPVVSVTEIMSRLSRNIRVNCPKNQSDVHHLRFAQSRALTRNVSDEFTVFRCAADTIARFIGVVMNWHGGASRQFDRCSSLDMASKPSNRNLLNRFASVRARSAPSVARRQMGWQARGCLQQNSSAGGLTPTFRGSRLYLYERARLRGALSALDTPMAIISASVTRSSTSEIASRTSVIIKRTVQVFTFLQSRHRRKAVRLAQAMGASGPSMARTT